MPALPLIDALILAGSAGLAVGFVLKVLWITTSYRPTFLGFSPMDVLIMSGTCLALALTLAARTWVKHQEARTRSRERLLPGEAELGVGLAKPAAGGSVRGEPGPATPAGAERPVPRAGESTAAS